MKIEMKAGSITATAETVADVQKLLALKDPSTVSTVRAPYTRNCNKGCGVKVKGNYGQGQHDRHYHKAAGVEIVTKTQ